MDSVDYDRSKLTILYLKHAQTNYEKDVVFAF